MENFDLKQIFEKAKNNPTLTVAGALVVLALLYLIVRHFKLAKVATQGGA